MTSTSFPPVVVRSPRLLLREPRAAAGPLDGAWWPRTANPEAELCELVAAVAPRLGQLVRVGFDWTADGITTKSNGAGGAPIELSNGGRTGGIMRLFGLPDNRMSLLVVPADISPELAAVQMRWATGQPLPGKWNVAGVLRTKHAQPRCEASDKKYPELIRDLIALRRSRSAILIDTELDRAIREHEDELHRRDRHGR